MRSLGRPYADTQDVPQEGCLPWAYIWAPFIHSKGLEAGRRANKCQSWRSGIKGWPEVL